MLVSKVSVSTRAQRTCGVKHTNQISLGTSSYLQDPVSSSMSGNWNGVEISFQICEGVRADIGCCGKYRIHRTPTDAGGQIFFISIACMSS